MTRKRRTIAVCVAHNWADWELIADDHGWQQLPGAPPLPDPTTEWRDALIEDRLAS